MASVSSWVPDENSQTLFSERCWLQGALISAIAYGITLPLYFLTFYHLVVQNGVESKNRIRLLIFMTIYLLLGTVYMTGLAEFTQMSFIDDRNFPGGPSAFEVSRFAPVPVQTVANATFLLSNWLADALVVWRFKVIYQSCGVPLWIVMIIPCIILTGCVAMGVVYLIEFQLSNTTPYVTQNISFLMLNLILSLSLNVILTIAIVLRLLVFRRRIVSVMGPKYGTRYVSAAAMMIESAAPYSALSLTFFVLFGLNNSVVYVFSQSLNQFQTIATLLILFRVAQGKGWTHYTATHAMSGSHSSDLESMRFAPPEVSLTPKGSMEVIRLPSLK